MTHEKFAGERTLMRIHIGESDKWHGKPLHEAIVELPQGRLFRGDGAARGWRVWRLERLSHGPAARLSQDLPIIVEVIESTERIDGILPRLDQMIEGGLITLEKVRVILYRAAKK